MSLFTGIYSSHPVHEEGYKSILLDFSLQGERKIETAVRNHLIISSFRHGYEYEHIKENGSSILAFSGRIFDIRKDYAYLKSAESIKTSVPSPAEYLLYRYRIMGTRFLDGINGNFSVMVYDKETNRLILGNDRLGIYPLFIYHDQDVLIFSNEYQPILSYDRCNKAVDHTAVAEYFLLGSPMEGRTFIQRISILPPATLLTALTEDTPLLGIQKSRLKISQQAYFEHSFSINRSDTPDQLALRLADLLRGAARRRADDPENILADISGGKDSRLFMGLITDEQRARVHFQTFQSAWMKNEENQDMVIALRLAQRYQLQHQFTPVVKNWAYEPERFISQWFDFRRIRYTEKKRMTGYQAGILSGKIYSRMKRFGNPEPERDVRQRLRAVFERGFVKKARNPAEILRSVYDDMHFENADKWIIFNQVYRPFFSTYNRGIISETNDLHNWPTRFDTLFFDQDLIEFLMTLKVVYIQDYYLYKKAYWDHFPELLEIPSSRAGFNQDESLSNPFPIVFTEKVSRFKEVYRKFLSSDQTWDRGIYNRKYFSTLKKIEDNPHFFCFIDFELWCRRYLT